MGAAFIEPAICHGCGICVSECPGRAIQLMHYTDTQTLTKVDALFKKDYLEIDIIPIDEIGVLKVE
jgi:formate hydrogenlyase subunit 6/NADH:ubiquinone oxidoreductase subunit I